MSVCPFVQPLGNLGVPHLLHVPVLAVLAHQDVAAAHVRAVEAAQQAKAQPAGEMKPRGRMCKQPVRGMCCPAANATRANRARQGSGCSNMSTVVHLSNDAGPQQCTSGAQTQRGQQLLNCAGHCAHDSNPAELPAKQAQYTAGAAAAHVLMAASASSQHGTERTNQSRN